MSTITEQTLELKRRLKIKYKDKLEIKCIADEIWLYCRFMFDDIDSMLKIHNATIDGETKKQVYAKLEEYYKNIRGEIFYQGKKTAAYAGGIFYIVCVLMGLYITQPNICEKLHISSTSLRHAYQELRGFYKK